MSLQTHFFFFAWFDISRQWVLFLKTLKLSVEVKNRQSGEKNMRNLTKGFLLLSFSFIFFIPQVAEAETSDTDRVIVEVEDKHGKEEIQSVTWEELERELAIKNAKDIEVLQPDYIRSIGVESTSTTPTLWATERIGLKYMKNQFLSNKEEVIAAVIDTGVDYTHSLLKDRVISGYDFVDNDTDPMDEHFHGTHVAGIIAEATTPNVKIMPIRSLNKTGSGYDTNIAKSIHYAVDHGAAVINMSFEGTEFSQHLADAINYAVSKNVLVVIAAGNKGGNTANYYPASEQKAIVVSATDQNDQIANFSNTGDSIDISAPGVGIYSSVPGERFAKFDGTSMAAPYVTGIIAMLKLENPTRTMEQLETMVKMYVDDKGAPYWDPLFGEGILNVSTFGNYSYIQSVMHTPDYIAMPEQHNVPLNKIWTVSFNQTFTDDSIASVKLYSDAKEVPIQAEKIAIDQKLVVTPAESYEPNTDYLLAIKLKNGKKYLMKFRTGNE